MKVNNNNPLKIPLIEKSENSEKSESNKKTSSIYERVRSSMSRSNSPETKNEDASKYQSSGETVPGSSKVEEIVKESPSSPLLTDSLLSKVVIDKDISPDKVIKLSQDAEKALAARKSGNGIRFGSKQEEEALEVLQNISKESLSSLSPDALKAFSVKALLQMPVEALQALKNEVKNALVKKAFDKVPSREDLPAQKDQASAAWQEATKLEEELFPSAVSLGYEGLPKSTMIDKSISPDEVKKLSSNAEKALVARESKGRLARPLEEQSLRALQNLSKESLLSLPIDALAAFSVKALLQMPKESLQALKDEVKVQLINKAFDKVEELKQQSIKEDLIESVWKDCKALEIKLFSAD